MYAVIDSAILSCGVQSVVYVLYIQPRLMQAFIAALNRHDWEVRF